MALDTTVDDARKSPKRAQSDGEMVEQHSLADQIAADKHVGAQAVAANPFCAMKKMRTRPAGALGE